MPLIRTLLFLIALGLGYIAVEAYFVPPVDYPSLSEAQWRSRLSSKAFAVLREKDTEDAFSGELLKEKRPGVYVCAGCGQRLFSSADKYDSHTGWPSFTHGIAPESLATRRENTPLAVVVEVRCARCLGHLGHVFPDGPEPRRTRYCMNSAALRFEPDRVP